MSAESVWVIRFSRNHTICGAPILAHLMRLYASQGFSEFVLAAGHRKEILFDYFNGRFLGWNVKIVDTGEASDTEERIRCWITAATLSSQAQPTRTGPRH